MKFGALTVKRYQSCIGYLAGSSSLVSSGLLEVAALKIKAIPIPEMK